MGAMLTLTPTEPNTQPDPNTEKHLAAKHGPSPSLRLSEGATMDAVAHVNRALEQTRRRMDNLRSLIDRFELDDNDDGPRAA